MVDIGKIFVGDFKDKVGGLTGAVGIKNQFGGMAIAKMIEAIANGELKNDEASLKSANIDSKAYGILQKFANAIGKQDSTGHTITLDDILTRGIGTVGINFKGDNLEI